MKSLRRKLNVANMFLSNKNIEKEDHENDKFIYKGNKKKRKMLKRKLNVQG